MKRQRQGMKTGIMAISYLLIVLMIAVLTACGLKGADDSQKQYSC